MVELFRSEDPMAEAASKPVVIITGASAGLGKAISQKFAAGGFRILALARGQERLDALAAELSQITDVVTLSSDAAHPESATSAVSFALQSFGRIDLSLIHI